jgi:hypothetical protein
MHEYEILGLKPNATKDEIKKAYKEIAITCHPDKLMHITDEVEKEKRIDKFKKATIAYNKLSGSSAQEDIDINDDSFWASDIFMDVAKMFINNNIRPKAYYNPVEKSIEERILEGLKSSQAIAMLGIDILGANILGIQATPEMSRALETETREKLQQEADQAIYERRNFAVEQERKIKETELNTEIAVEEKQKQIAEKKMESEVQKADNDRKLREMKLAADIAVENQRKQFIEQKNANDKKEAETQGYVIETTLKPYKDIDWKTLTALNNNPDPKFNISLAFRELAENAGKIGNLNISPELLDTLLNDKRENKK